MTPATTAAVSRLVILYGIGGLSDVGRHAILAALEQPAVKEIKVVTEYPELLNETNWECGCPGGHTNPAKDHPDKVEVIPVESWKTGNYVDILKQQMNDDTAVVSCLGHRQPGWKYKELKTKGVISAPGNKQVIQAMQAKGVSAVIVFR